MALNAGYFFKCPNCNDTKKFRNSMLTQGLYIPNEWVICNVFHFCVIRSQILINSSFCRDAKWETTPNSFRELYEQYNICDASKCLCPSGKYYSTSKGYVLEKSTCNKMRCQNKRLTVLQKSFTEFEILWSGIFSPIVLKIFINLLLLIWIQNFEIILQNSWSWVIYPKRSLLKLILSNISLSKEQIGSKIC